ncbi:MAG: biosynthetic arginine decarboxylase [bacterium]
MWHIQDSIDLYQVNEWGGGFFRINGKGHVEVRPKRDEKAAIDLKVLIDEVQTRGIQLPILLRFSDILQERIRELHGSFENAIKEYNYQTHYQGVYPIKVNQQRHVVESIVKAGRKHHLGLEAGSKPELLTVMSILDDPDALIVCNGYKDEKFLQLALLGCKLGMKIIIVIEKFSEIEKLLALAKSLGVAPMIGLRVKLSSKGAGRWEASGGDRAKFGLGAFEILETIKLLRKNRRLENLQLLHYHLGSQICSVSTLRAALREAGRYFVELQKLGANLQYFDIGGGLAVDYDGSRTNFHSSANYSMQEYANTVVYEIMQICDENDVVHPVIVSESGRAITAYHSVLVTNALGVAAMPVARNAKPNLQNAPSQIDDLWDIYNAITTKNFQESYHDVLDMREQLLDLFKLGYIGLQWRAVGESLVGACLQKIFQITRRSDYVPEELQKLERDLADIYFCNLSIFQSLPDSWAVGHIFPIMPIHRLNEKPGHNAVLADITCDSDGKIDKFAELRDVRPTLAVHPFKASEEYVLGFFLVGAYQEILGDLHNLFGDNNAVHISWDDEDETYSIDHVEYGDTVTEVLNYVQQSSEKLINRFRAKVERSVRRKQVSISDSREILDIYRSGFDGYTYMEG